MTIRIITEPITRAEAAVIGTEWYADMVKGAVDLERGVIALGGEYHMDANTVLVEAGSSQKHVWGFNIYPARLGEDWIEYTALINIRPKEGNRAMTVQDESVRAAMRAIIERLIV